jgi:hypothetical protein
MNKLSSMKADIAGTYGTGRQSRAFAGRKRSCSPKKRRRRLFPMNKLSSMKAGGATTTPRL